MLHFRQEFEPGCLISLSAPITVTLPAHQKSLPTLIIFQLPSSTTYICSWTFHVSWIKDACWKLYILVNCSYARKKKRKRPRNSVQENVFLQMLLHCAGRKNTATLFFIICLFEESQKKKLSMKRRNEDKMLEFKEKSVYIYMTQMKSFSAATVAQHG